MLVFEERGKLEYLKKKLSEQSREPTTYDAQSGNRTQDILVGGERSHHCAIPRRRRAKPETFRSSEKI